MLMKRGDVGIELLARTLASRVMLLARRWKNARARAASSPSPPAFPHGAVRSVTDEGRFTFQHARGKQ